MITRYFIFLLGWLSVTAFLSIPYLLRTRHPKAYRGFWKVLGDALPESPRTPITVAMGGVLAVLSIVIGDYLTQGGISDLARINNPFLASLISGISFSLVVVVIIITCRRAEAAQRKNRS